MLQKPIECIFLSLKIPNQFHFFELQICEPNRKILFEYDFDFFKSLQLFNLFLVINRED
jgi:hypothetical protein